MRVFHYSTSAFLIGVALVFFGVGRGQSGPAKVWPFFAEVPDAFVQDKAPWFRLPFDAIATDMDLDGDPDLLINWHHHERLELLENRAGRFVRRNRLDADESGLFDNRGIANLFASETQMQQRIKQSGLAGLYVWHDENRGGFWRLLWHDPDSVIRARGQNLVVHIETTLPIVETSGFEEGTAQSEGERHLRVELSGDDPSHVVGIRVRRVATELRLRVESLASDRVVQIFIGSALTPVAGTEIHLWKPDPHGIAWLDVAGSRHPDLYITRGALGGELRPPAAPKRDRYYVAQAEGGRLYHRTSEDTIPSSYGRGRRVEWVDVDGDGVLELSISSDQTPNELLVLDAPTGHFRDDAPRLGLALEGGGVQAWGDLDDDGRPDLFYLSDGRINVLRNREGAVFEPVSGEALGLTVPEFEKGRGVIDPTALHLVDFDNDGDLDLCLSAFGKSGRLRLFRKDRSSEGTDVQFVDVSEQLGLSTLNGVRVALFEDFDGDAFVDIVVLGTKARFLHNQRGQSFRSVPLITGKKRLRVFAATIGDFDGDGRPDLVAVYRQRRLLHNRYSGSNRHVVVELRWPGRNPVGAVVRGYYSDGTVRAQRYGSARSSAFSQALAPLYFGSPPERALVSIGVQWPGVAEESRAAVSTGPSHLVLEPSRPGVTSP